MNHENTPYLKFFNYFDSKYGLGEMMNILYLGPKNTEILHFLEQTGCCISRREDKIAVDELRGIEYIISYGYRYIIDSQIVEKFRKRAINLHISYLPWNKGADPNLWSFLEDTPKGVTIHYIDRGLDTGEILLQKKVAYTPEDTLKTTYEKLKIEIEKLFIENWECIKSGQISGRKQDKSVGSYHRSVEKNGYIDLLRNGWDTKVIALINKAKHDEKIILR